MAIIRVKYNTPIDKKINKRERMRLRLEGCDLYNKLVEELKKTGYERDEEDCDNSNYYDWMEDVDIEKINIKNTINGDKELLYAVSKGDCDIVNFLTEVLGCDITENVIYELKKFIRYTYEDLYLECKNVVENILNYYTQKLINIRNFDKAYNFLIDIKMYADKHRKCIENIVSQCYVKNNIEKLETYSGKKYDINFGVIKDVVIRINKWNRLHTFEYGKI